MKQILLNWNFMRSLRLILAIALMVQAVLQKDILVFFLGLFLFITALANIGCCGTNACSVPKGNKNFNGNESLDQKK